VFPSAELKRHIIEALRATIAGVVKGAVVFQNVQIISPLAKKTT
jgi:LysR family hydrogen peroxide-inducible transcriptional activator